jgi:tryptophan-rich sensory protein
MLLSVLAVVVSIVPIRFAGSIEWYDTLSKPFFAAPGWLFDPALVVLFLLMAIAFYIVWQKWPAKEAKMAMSLYLALIALNVVWISLFFGQHNAAGIMFALAESVVLLAMAVLTTCRFYQLDRRAGYLLVPCLLWGAYAVCLSGALWLMNPGA